MSKDAHTMQRRTFIVEIVVEEIGITPELPSAQTLANLLDLHNEDIDDENLGYFFPEIKVYDSHEHYMQDAPDGIIPLDR